MFTHDSIMIPICLVFIFTGINVCHPMTPAIRGSLAPAQPPAAVPQSSTVNNEILHNPVYRPDNIHEKMEAFDWLEAAYGLPKEIKNENVKPKGRKLLAKSGSKEGHVHNHHQKTKTAHHSKQKEEKLKHVKNAAEKGNNVQKNAEKSKARPQNNLGKKIMFAVFWAITLILARMPHNVMIQHGNQFVRPQNYTCEPYADGGYRCQFEVRGLMVDGAQPKLRLYGDVNGDPNTVELIGSQDASKCPELEESVQRLCETEFRVRSEEVPGMVSIGRPADTETTKSEDDGNAATESVAGHRNIGRHLVQFTGAIPGGEQTPPADQAAVPDSGSAKLVLYNGCEAPIWPGYSSSDPGSNRVISTTGEMIPQGGSIEVMVPSDWTAGRVWANFGCDTGTCNLQAAQPPVSLAEFTLSPANTGDFMDVSNVDGSNVPMSISQVQGTYTGDACRSITFDRAVVGTLVQNLPPDALQLDPSGQTVIGVKSVCMIDDSDTACCRGANQNHDACPVLNNWSQAATDAYNLYKQAFPGQYLFAYNDDVATVVCTGANGNAHPVYQIGFCANPEDIPPPQNPTTQP